MSKVITRRERREQMRQQRPQRAPAARRSGIPTAWIGVGAVAAVIVVAVVLYQLGVFAPGAPATLDLRSSKYDLAGEVVGQQLPDEGRDHLSTGQKATYQSNPPTSGPHWNAGGVSPAPWGVKDTTLPDEVIVHNLEHGGVVVFYKGLSPEETSKLRELVRQLLSFGFPKIVLEPYPQMPSDARIALSAWRWQLKLPGYDDVQIVKFMKAHYDGPDAPERGVR